MALLGRLLFRTLIARIAVILRFRNDPSQRKLHKSQQLEYQIGFNKYIFLDKLLRNSIFDFLEYLWTKDQLDCSIDNRMHILFYIKNSLPLDLWSKRELMILNTKYCILLYIQFCTFLSSRPKAQLPKDINPFSRFVRIKYSLLAATALKMWRIFKPS